MAHLFAPLRVRGVEFKNRIFMAPMCQYSCGDDGIPTPWHTVHLGTRAVGGVALAMVEATAVCPEGRISPQDTGLYDDAQERAFAELAATLRALGTRPGIQLAHAGRKASTYAPWRGHGAVPPERGGWQVVGPTEAAFAPHYPPPTALDAAGIARTVEQFVMAAERSRRAGFDVVELHFAHGYLAAQFLAPEVNVRSDAYGGPAWESRARLALDIASAVRTVWPSDRPLFARLSVTNWLNVDRDIGESTRLARALRERGVDVIDCSSGGLVQDAPIPANTPGYQVPLAAALKRDADVATAAVGLITHAQQAENILADGHADAVFLGRALLREPYWPLHAAGQFGIAPTPWPAQYARAL